MNTSLFTIRYRSLTEGRNIHARLCIEEKRIFCTFAESRLAVRVVLYGRDLDLRDLKEEEIPDADLCLRYETRHIRCSLPQRDFHQRYFRGKRHSTTEKTTYAKHELRTPVSSIQGYLETLLNVENIPAEKRQQFIEHSYARCVRLSHLVNDIGLLNKMDSVDPLFEREDLDLSELIFSVLNDVSLEIEKKHVSLLLSLPEKPPIHGNKSLLYSIFRNMIDNSLAYAGQNFNLRISCYHSDEDENVYYLSYSDSGIGVAGGHLNHLFDRFYRVDKGRSRKAGGTGLGLAIVKHAVQFHQGTILAKIPSEGGPEFLFTLRKE